MTGSPGRGADAVPRKLALITGASSGIGRAFALRLAAEGYDLILVARDSRRLETLAAELHAAHGINAEVLAADLTDPPQLLAVERCITRADTLDLLINNAGFITVGSFADNDPDGQEAMIRLHVIATVRLTRAALPGMIARGSGSIINVSSLAAFFPAPGNVSYFATKSYVKDFTETLQFELIGTGVRLMALCPGWTHTEIHQRQGADESSVPRGWWMTPDYVVAEALKCLRRGRLCCIPGFRCRMVALLSVLLPTPLKRWLTRKYYERRARRLGVT